MGETLRGIEKAVKDAERVNGNFSLTPKEEQRFENYSEQQKINGNLEETNRDFSEKDFNDQLDGTDVNLTQDSEKQYSKINGNLLQQDTLQSDNSSLPPLKYNQNIRYYDSKNQVTHYPGNVYISNGAVQKGKVNVDTDGNINISGKEVIVNGKIETNGDISIGGYEE